MWLRFRILPVLIVTLWALFSSPAKADVDISVFVNALSPYGTWVNHGLYGQVWFPRGVPYGWRPYTDGRWVFTVDYGWIWESDWDWGWAPFHYGRWAWDDWYGWMWIPGRVWAPAWVFWRFGGGYVAWAPMPPDVAWRPGFGLHSPRFHMDRDMPWDFWNCVEARHFPDRRIHHRILAPNNNLNIMRITQNVTNVTVINNRIVNRSIPLQHIEQATGRRIHSERVREGDDIASRHRERRPGELTVIRPRHVEALTRGGGEREQDELIDRIARDRDARRQAQPGPEQFRPRVPRRLLESRPEREGGRFDAERPRQIQGRDHGQREQFPLEQQRRREEQVQRQQEMERRAIEQPRQIREQEPPRQEERQRQREEQTQRQQETERRTVEQQRQEEQTRQIREQEQRQQQELQRQQEQQRQQREEQMQRQQEVERRAVEQQRQEEQTRQIREQEQRQQQELQRQREEQMQRQQEVKRRGMEQRRQEDQLRQSQERALRQQQEHPRQQEQQRQRMEQTQRQQESGRRQVEQPRQIQELRQRQQAPQGRSQQEQIQHQRQSGQGFGRPGRGQVEQGAQP
jgi:hypothetical protein